MVYYTGQWGTVQVDGALWVTSLVWGRHLAEVARDRLCEVRDTQAVGGDFSSATLKQGMWRFYYPIFLQQMFCGDVDPTFIMFALAH